MNHFLIDSMGWLGSLILIVGYWLVSQNRIDTQSLSYHLVNITGSILLIINTIFYGAYPSATANLIWMVIGAFYILKTRHRVKKGALPVNIVPKQK